MPNELHSLLRNNPNVDDVQALIDKYPYALQEKDDFGWLPLHVAIIFSASYEVLELLINEYPDAARVGDDEIGSLPLHYAAERASVAVVQLLISVYPDAVETDNCEGNLPVHYATSVEVTQLLN